ncbi:MAG: ATP-binding cassette domain-containing protein, partial [Pedobacter sp.]|nr:ATP-binding cassette domain-containing protein [Pedobacter sp.]
LMFSYYWKLGLLMLLIIPIYLTIYLIANQFYKKINRKLMEQSAELESLLVENIRTIGTIKRFDLASFVYTKIETKFIKLLKTGYQSGLTTIVSSTSVEVCSHLFTILLLWAGTGHVLDREITPGELFSFYALIGYFTSPAAALIGSNKIIQEAFIAADRLFEIMDLQIDSPQQGIELQRAQLGDIRFEKVAFGYNNRSKVFEGLDLTIKIGQLTAIVGESGSGKSTIMSLLQQLYPLMEGKIYIGKYPLQHIDQEALGKLMAVVPQDVDLFAGTITANIAIGEYRPDMGRIVDICTQLAILDFIHTLPKGFDTELGENGATLSGGQKQKIALARALYRDPEILILDEATSALDSQSEFVIRNTLDLLVQKGKTIIVIAHRLSIIKHAHHIILLQNGGVMEEGTHAELMSRPNHYHDLWTKQFGNELISSTPI